MYLGKPVNFRCHLFNDHIIILGSFKDFNVALTLVLLRDNKYKLTMDYYYGLQHRSRVLNNESLDRCLDGLDIELKNLNKRLEKYRSMYGR